MKTFKMLAALAVIGTLGSPAAAQMTNSMGNSMGNMGTTPMGKGTMPDRSIDGQKREWHDGQGHHAQWDGLRPSHDVHASQDGLANGDVP